MALTTPGPVEDFISAEIEPRRNEMRTVRQPKKHTSILLEDARKRRRVAHKKIGTSYLLLRGGRTIGGVDGGMTTLVSEQARRVTQSLLTTRRYLRASGVPTLPAKVFHADQAVAAEKQRLRLGSAVTIRPASVSADGGTTVGVTTSEGFHKAWDRATEALRGLPTLRQQVQVQAHRPGLALRVFVVGETPAAAVVRVPLYVVGDGRSTVAELVEAEKARHQQCRYLGPLFPIVDDAFLAESGLRLRTVPWPGQVTMLRLSPEAPGAVTIDVLERISPDLAELAVEAMWSLPGLGATAVDILTPSLDSAEEATVTGVDPAARLYEFLYPTYGTYRRCGLAILDDMIAAAG